MITILANFEANAGFGLFAKVKKGSKNLINRQL